MDGKYHAFILKLVNYFHIPLYIFSIHISDTNILFLFSTDMLIIGQVKVFNVNKES